MDRVRATGFGNTDDLFDGQIGGHGAHAFANFIGLISLEPVQAQLVLFGIDRHGAFAQLVGGTHHTDGNLASVGYEDFLEVGHR